jgi:pseudouridine kinase
MARVIVIGGANVDIKGRASNNFIGATSNPGEVTLSVGGVGRNIAENLARLGQNVSLLTVLGDDSNGRLVRAASEAAGVDLSLTRRTRGSTGTYLVILDRKGELQSAINDMSAIEELRPEHLDAASDALSAADLLVVDCNISASCLEWLCAFAARADKRLVIEPVSVPKARKLLVFKRNKPILAITPNEQQLFALTNEKALAPAVKALHALGFSNVVVHRGAAGAVASTGDDMRDVPAFPVADVADVTGAGDAAVAGMVAGLLENLPLWKAARLGQAAAAIKLSSRDSVSTLLSRDSVRTLAGF